MGILKDLLEKNDIEGLRWAIIPAHFNLLNFSNWRDSNESDLPEVWVKNVGINLEWAKKNKDKIIGSVWDLPKHKNQAAIFIGASPILRKQWKAFREADERFVTIAVNSSAKFLINRGIKPDYVIYVDGKTSPDWSLNLGKKEEDIVLMASFCAAPEVLENWRGKVCFIPYRLKECPKEMRKIKRRYKKFMPAGGNAFNAAIIIMMLCTEMKIFLFAGNELSWKRRYYVHTGGTNDSGVYYFAKDIHGKKVKTNVPLYNYKVWLEHVMCLSYPNYVFFNCSEGILGVDVDGDHLPFVYQETLENAIELTKGAFGFEKLPWEEQNRLIYEDAYQQRGYHPTHSDNLWPMILDAVPFDRALDVGCGEGQGIKKARDMGKDVWGIDIADISRIWKENGIADYCMVAPAHKMPFDDNSFEFIVCSETMEHVPMDGIDDTLKEIYRVGSDKFLFTIALTHDTHARATGVGYHVTLKPKEWWFDKLEEHGFKIGYTALTEMVESKSVIIMAVKDQEPYEQGHKHLWLADEGKTNAEEDRVRLNTM